MVRVLFVCLGNICRSPMADAVFTHLVGEAGLADAFQVDSAGTGGWHSGQRPCSGTIEVLHRHAIPYNGRARQITEFDLRAFDHIYAMDRENLRDIQGLAREPQYHQKIALFLEQAYTHQAVETLEVPDPYYVGNFDTVFRLVHAGSAAIVDHLRQVHRL
jgi:protein-tyrosine phosphatase